MRSGLHRRAPRVVIECAGNPSRIEDALDTVAKRELDPAPLRTWIVSLLELPDMFASLSYDARQVKVMIDPSRI